MTFTKDHKFYPGGVLFKKGQKPWNKDPTEKIRKIIRDAAKNRKRPTSRRNNHYNWHGGKIIQEGYNYLLMPEHPRAKSKKGYVAEHVLVIEKHLGRYLNQKEIVHHKDGNKLNNHLRNLFLFPNNKVHINFHKQNKLKEEQFLRKWQKNKQ